MFFSKTIDILFDFNDKTICFLSNKCIQSVSFLVGKRKLEKIFYCEYSIKFIVDCDNNLCNDIKIIVIFKKTINRKFFFRLPNSFCHYFTIACY